MTQLTRTERSHLRNAIEVCDAHPEFTTNDAASKALRTMLQEASTGTPPATPPPVVPTPPVVVPTFQLPAGHRTITGTVNAPNGSAVDGDQDHAPGFHIEAEIKSKLYCLYAGVPWRVVNSNLVSTGPGDGYCIRVTAGGEILNSTLDNTANPNTKNTLRATGFDYLRIDGVQSRGDGWLLGFGAADGNVNRLGGSGLFVTNSRIDITGRAKQPCIEISDTLHNSRWENVDLITPWPDRAINLWYGSSGHVFKGCTVNGAPLSASNIRHVKQGAGIPLVYEKRDENDNIVRDAQGAPVMVTAASIT